MGSNPFFALFQDTRILPQTGVGQAIERGLKAAEKVGLYLQAAKIANPEVAKVLLTQCQEAYLEAASEFAVAADLISSQFESIDRLEAEALKLEVGKKRRELY